MIVVGSHDLTFITLYRMKMFGILAAVPAVVSAGIAVYVPDESANLV
jgi:hypothetical protein